MGTYLTFLLDQSTCFKLRQSGAFVNCDITSSIPHTILCKCRLCWSDLPICCCFVVLLQLLLLLLSQLSQLSQLFVCLCVCCLLVVGCCCCCLLLFVVV